MLKSDTQLARQLAIEAGKILFDIKSKGIYKGKELGNLGDAQSNEFIINELKRLRPDDYILSEEEKDNLERLGKKRVWIIDPLDGTREYSSNRDDWAVHIALTIDNKPIIGAVSIPERNEVFTSEDNLTPFPLHSPLKITVSRSRTPQIALEVAQKLSAELIPCGSAGVKAIEVLKGNADIYIHSGGQHEWDNCAPFAVCLGNGLHCSRLDGSEIIYNQQNTFVYDLLICKKSIADTVLGILNK